MPKMKTHSSLKGRFKITGTGKVMRYKQGKNHLLSGKSSKQKRVIVHEPNNGSWRCTSFATTIVPYQRLIVTQLNIRTSFIYPRR